MGLHVPTDGPCAGHPCDNCRICQRGRCCRNDDPHYQLPALGEWEGPIYGELGVLTNDGEKAQCHCCGEFFGLLAMHAWHTHNLMADEYRAIFGLNYRTGLVGPATAEKKRQASLRNGTAQNIKDHPGYASKTPEQRWAANHGRPKRLQNKRNVERQLQQLRDKDSDFYVAWHAKMEVVFAAARHPLVERKCPACLATFVVRQGSKKIYCNRECYTRDKRDGSWRERHLEACRARMLNARALRRNLSPVSRP